MQAEKNVYELEELEESEELDELSDAELPSSAFDCFLLRLLEGASGIGVPLQTRFCIMSSAAYTWGQCPSSHRIGQVHVVNDSVHATMQNCPHIFFNGFHSTFKGALGSSTVTIIPHAFHSSMTR